MKAERQRIARRDLNSEGGRAGLPRQLISQTTLPSLYFLPQPLGLLWNLLIRADDLVHHPPCVGFTQSEFEVNLYHLCDTTFWSHYRQL
jgi:hypothetical protein